MKILKFIVSVLWDIIKPLPLIVMALLVILLIGGVAFSVLLIAIGTSCWISNLFGHNQTVLYACLLMWFISIFSFFEGLNPILEFKKDISNLKKYFINKWNKISR